MMMRMRMMMTMITLLLHPNATTATQEKASTKKGKQLSTLI
jgi:hypothetical protein